MPLIDINRNPTDRQLRQFGVIGLFFLPLMGWLWGGTEIVVGTLAGLGATIALTSLVRPVLVKPLFVGLSLLTAPIGIVVGELLLILIFLGVFLPLGLMFRVARRDALQLKFDRGKDSYWQPKPSARSTSSYFHQS